MKTKFNLIGNTFTHLSNGNKGYSVHGKMSEYIEWIHPAVIPGIDTFYIDDAFRQAAIDSISGKKYLWLLESKWISSALSEIKKFPFEFLDIFECIFTHDQELLALDPNFKFVPAQGSWIRAPGLYNKSKTVSMITSNKNWTAGHRERLDWANRFKEHMPIFGRGFNEIEFKEEGLCDYLFSVAIENGQYETYFTEKILDCFLTGTIPIYLGAPDIANHFNIDGIIPLTDSLDLSQLNLELYESKLDAINDNFSRALKMEVLEDYIWERYLA